MSDGLVAAGACFCNLLMRMTRLISAGESAAPALYMSSRVSPALLAAGSLASGLSFFDVASCCVAFLVVASSFWTGIGRPLVLSMSSLRNRSLSATFSGVIAAANSSESNSESCFALRESR